MATFAELVSDVYTLTNRPDLVDETALAVKAATLKAHHTDFYPKDLFSTAIIWNPVGYIQSLEYKTLIPKWRAFKHLRKYDPTADVSSQDGVFFDMIDPLAGVDEYKVNRENVCYLAGSSIKIRSNTQDTYMLVGCYLHPDITVESFDSWIAQDYPYAIVYEAVAKIFKSIGWDEQATLMSKEVADQYVLLRNSNILGQGS